MFDAALAMLGKAVEASLELEPRCRITALTQTRSIPPKQLANYHWSQTQYQQGSRQMVQNHLEK
jgi:hypothetical protein